MNKLGTFFYQRIRTFTGRNNITREFGRIVFNYNSADMGYKVQIVMQLGRERTIVIKFKFVPGRDPEKIGKQIYYLL